jgi:hypothetical protein
VFTCTRRFDSCVESQEVGLVAPLGTRQVIAAGTSSPPTPLVDQGPTRRTRGQGFTEFALELVATLEDAGFARKIGTSAGMRGAQNLKREAPAAQGANDEGVSIGCLTRLRNSRKHSPT